MRLASGFGIVFVIAIAAGCTNSGKTTASGTSETLSEALTRGVKFAHGQVKKGALPKPNPSGDKLRLVTDAVPLTMEPGKGSIMALDADNPDEDMHPVAATLMRFEDSDSHIEVPVGANASHLDAGSGATALLHIENAFTVSKDICQFLCNERLTAHVTITARLDNGGICQQQTQDLELDCTNDGDPKQCGKTSGSGSSKIDAGAKRDAGPKVDAGAKPDAAQTAKVDGSSGSGGKGGGGDAGAPDASVSDAGTRDAGPYDAGPYDAGPYDAGFDAAVDAGRDSGGGDSGSHDASVDAGHDSGGGDGGSNNGPQLASITPTNTTVGAAPTLTITGTGFIAGASVYVDGVAVSTTVVSATSITADVPATSTANSGNLAVSVQNVPGTASTSSNILYVQVDPAAGAPVVYDYSPDNGIVGDKILIIATNLAGQTLTIKDTNGTVLTPGTLSTISWPTAGTVDTVEVTLPTGIATGPLTVTNTLGSFKGKIFTVGSNLTRATGTVLDSSSEYNTSNWARASGGDNLLSTSFFTANGDCASMTSCTIKPWFKITFASAQTVARIAMRGNREYASGYDFLNGKFELLGVSDVVLWEGTYDLPDPDRDIDLTMSTPVPNVLSVKFSGLADESNEPGFSELEVFGP